MGVIDARDAAQLEAALQQLAGGLSNPITSLRDRLLDLVAHLEANLDFTEERDVEPVFRASLAQELTGAAESLEAITVQLSARERISGQPRVVLTGPPNAGKSRLFNALLGNDRAIVSPLAGTTRDYIAETCECEGLLVDLVDTAGLDAPSNAVTKGAQDLRAGQAAQADLLLECYSVETSPPPSRLEATSALRIGVRTKADLASPEPDASFDQGLISTSAVTGAGLPLLRSEIARLLLARDGDLGAFFSTGARCRGSLSRAAAALQSASQIILASGGDELVAFDLRLAAEELGAVVGAVVTDDILDRIFRRFCIGK
jgi:tRNA modification GTPase